MKKAPGDADPLLFYDETRYELKQLVFPTRADYEELGKPVAPDPQQYLDACNHLGKRYAAALLEDRTDHQKTLFISYHGFSTDTKGKPRDFWSALALTLFSWLGQRNEAPVVIGGDWNVKFSTLIEIASPSKGKEKRNRELI